MTLEQAKQLKYGNYIHHTIKMNADGTPMRAKVTSIKTWKTRPERIIVRYKRGLYEYGEIREYDLDMFAEGYGS